MGGTKVAIYSAVTLTISIFTLMISDNAYAEVNSKTLESVALPTGISEGVAEIKTGFRPVLVTVFFICTHIVAVARSKI